MGEILKPVRAAVSAMLGALVGWGTSLAGATPSKAWIWGLLAAILLLGIVAFWDARQSRSSNKGHRTSVTIRAGRGASADRNTVNAEQGAAVDLHAARDGHIDEAQVDASAADVDLKARRGGSVKGAKINAKE